MSRPLASGLHVATLAHGGYIWEIYLELEDEGSAPSQTHRGRLRFDLASQAVAAKGDSPPARTGMMIVEASREDAIAKARSFDKRLLADLLRSALAARGEV